MEPHKNVQLESLQFPRGGGEVEDRHREYTFKLLDKTTVNQEFFTKKIHLWGQGDDC